MFFSHEHEPIHVHVVGKGGDAKYVWDGEKFNLLEKHDIKSADLRRIKMMIDDNSDIIVNNWKRYFKQKDDEDQ